VGSSINGAIRRLGVPPGEIAYLPWGRNIQLSYLCPALPGNRTVCLFSEKESGNATDVEWRRTLALANPKT
jgi:hypothetical protein